jgi:MYXO-CTERM domain-containing protein
VRKFNLLSALVIGAVASGISTSADAALLEYEPFNYPSNLGSSLNGLNGGIGWGGPWSNATTDVTVATTNASLSYPANVPLTPAGSRVAVAGVTDGGTSGQATRTLGTTMNLGTNGLNFYSSALVQRSAVAGETDSVNFFSGGNLRWYYGIDSTGHFSVAVDPGNASQRATSTATAASNTTYLLVARIRTNTGPGGNDEVFLKVFAPTDTVSEPLTDADWDLTSNGNSGVTLSTVRLDFANASGQTNQFDEFRAGTSFADVAGVPEPGALSLVALGGLPMLRRRRRA